MGFGSRWTGWCREDIREYVTRSGNLAERHAKVLFQQYYRQSWKRR